MKLKKTHDTEMLQIGHFPYIYEERILLCCVKKPVCF